MPNVFDHVDRDRRRDQHSRSAEQLIVLARWTDQDLQRIEILFLEAWEPTSNGLARERDRAGVSRRVEVGNDRVADI